MTGHLGGDLHRLKDWPERLSHALSQRGALVWSETDCACWAASSAEAVTGVDPAAPYRGRYESYGEGLALIGLDGFRHMKHWADRWWPRIPPAMARRGDWAWVRDDAPDGRARYALMVVDGAVLRGPAGGRISRDQALICWKVG